ncbi:alpha-xylosidase [Spirochaetia bacterium]|nr:alpha-xylosidase [Spirochaetia bacterium]
MNENTTALIFQTGEHGTPQVSLRLTRFRENTWRLQAALADGSFDDHGAAQILARDLGEDPPVRVLPFNVIREENKITVQFDKQQLLITPSPFSLSVTNTGDAAAKGLYISNIEKDGHDFTVRGTLADGEAIFGGGERFNHANQRGKLLEMVAIDRWAETEGNSYVPVPLMLSSRGYALFLNRYERSLLDFGANDPGVWILKQINAPLDLYIFINDDPIRTLNNYSALTGFAPMPASWLFGIQVSRHLRLGEFSTIAGIEMMMKKMAENDFPWDAIIAEGWDTFNPETYEDLRKIVATVHAGGKKFLLYEPCGRVSINNIKEKHKETPIVLEPQFKTEYLVSETDGNTWLSETATYNPADAPDPWLSRFIDITNPEAMKWWLDFIWKRLVQDIGVDGCKIDFCEQFPDHIPLRFNDGRSSSGAHHWYPTLYNTIMYRYFNKHRPEGGMNFSRGGSSGAQRYPFIWCGDQRREFSFLQTILTSILSSGLSGIPFMSYDMAGYAPGNNTVENPEEKVFIRGTEMSCFSSNMQTHGTVTRPYDFAEPVKDIYRIYAKLHEKLRPYLLEQAECACKTGTPLLRHLFLYDPKDSNLFNIEDEYMLGAALLIAPVFSEDEARDIYLPKGTWRNILDSKTYQGKQTLKAFAVPFRQIPVFLLEGNDSKTIDAVLAEAQKLLDILR